MQDFPGLAHNPIRPHFLLDPFFHLTAPRTLRWHRHAAGHPHVRYLPGGPFSNNEELRVNDLQRTRQPSAL